MTRRIAMERQRGEGKMGCILTLLIFGALVAAALKIVPVYYNNSELADGCHFIASSASRIPLELVEKQAKDKARELGMADVLAQPNSITASKSTAGTGESGTCTIHLKYKQTIDLYGIYKFEVVTDRKISEPILEGIG